jgi:3',5'-cyclic AMP phosphodiesterase CpdA
MTIKDDNERQRKVLLDRREALTCMTWAGTGLLWAMNGGAPLTKGLIGDAHAAASAPKEFAFVQISDSHIGFNKPANPDAMGTLKEAIAKIKALPVQPAFMIHTGDISHLSKDEEFDNADQLIKEAGLPVFYVPGEHDVIDDGRGQSYRTRYGKNAQGSGWHSFDYNGVHYIGLVNVMDLKAGGLGNLGDEQLTWLEKDVSSLSSSTPLVVFAHIPLWTVYPEWGWGTNDAAKALSTLKRFGSLTILNGHIHQIMQKIEGNAVFHTARSTAFPQPAPGTASSPGPMKVPAGELKNYLGIASVSFVANSKPLAIMDAALSANPAL